ncbi:MAG: hypothetical protein O6844_07525, partial [Gammaproteobacteria bacterium]|nr:hypothetical protein [Gammaproteobacteria bacterium]
ATQTVAVAAFLRVINTLENIRSGIDLLDRATQAIDTSNAAIDTLLERALHDTDDAIQVLTGGGLHPEAATRLEAAAQLIRRAKTTRKRRLRTRYVRAAMAAQNDARNHLTVMQNSGDLETGDSYEQT